MVFDEPDPDVNKYLCELQNYSRSKDIIFKRYVSYDFCYNYFHNFKNKEEIKDNMELSCLQLGFYLASWGLYRGSSKQFLRSHKIYVEVISRIADEKKLWEVDVDTYSEGNICRIIEFKKDIESILSDKFFRLFFDPIIEKENYKDKQKVSDTLITKIMMGTFGCVPALDVNFKEFIGYRDLNKESLDKIHSYYIQNRKIIDKYHIKTLDVDYNETENEYKKARLIDYVGFREGEEILKNKDLKRKQKIEKT
ncbi:hypothetical protein RSJ42_04520 [Methanosarcina hadiensis]|uniref:hypothetical protein n=1 Tax=Methanosarcina hadiensis TaxID=3078083 RepID=UPI0039775591